MVKAKAKSQPAAAQNVARLSAEMYKASINVFIEMIKAGKSNLMQGYASTIMVADFLYTAGLLRQEAKDRIFLLGDFIQALAGITDIGVLFGGQSPFAPTLNTSVEQTGGQTPAEGAEALASLIAKAVKVLPK
jgi:hypothetical protein